VAGATPAPLDLLLLFLVAALAFLLASFPARNSELWKDLAAGRLLARGEYAGGDGGAFAVLRGNPAWLYDLVAYGLYSALGGTGLVLFKALLVAGLAVVLARLSHVGSGWLLPVACTALALLVMSTRLLLQPVVVSYLFLALALWFVRERRPAAERRASPLLPPWPLVVLFVVWVNVDGWFVLGLATVALVWLGRSLDEATESGGAWVRPLLGRAGALAVLAAACLLNPSHVHAFAVPRELAAVLDPASSAALGGLAQVTSPFQQAYFATFGLSPAGLAYFPLLGLGLVSFVLNLPRPHWERLLPWLGLALLSAVQVRAVPFFAVVAGPVLAWNLHSWLARRAAVSPAFGGARGLAATLGLVLVVCAWPGWLQGPPFEPRRWSVEPPPSLERAAAAVRQWHEDGKLVPDARGLHLSPDTLYAFAWFCPQEQGLLSPDLAGPIRGDQEAPHNWWERMHAAGVNHVVVYDSDRARFRATVQRLWSAPTAWPMLYLEGDVAVFGWRDPAAAGAADAFGDWQMDLVRMTFQPDRDKRAPRDGPGREPKAREWWEALWKPAPRRSADLEEAALYLAQAEVAAQDAPYRLLTTWYLSQFAGAAGAAGGWAGGGPGAPAAALFDAQMRFTRLDPPAPDKGPVPEAQAGLDRAVRDWQRRFSFQQDDAPPPLLYLAVRAARRSLAANPDDAEAQRVLGQAYMRLMRSTRERSWAAPARLTDLGQLRSVQASAALNRAVALNPNLADAHLRLFDLYRGMNYLDLALEHLRTYVRLVQQTAPRDPAAAKAFHEQLAPFEEDLKRLTRDVEDRENTYATAASTVPLVLDRARLASQKGLARKARDMLLESDVSAFGKEGTKMELQLLLTTGRARDVRDWIGPEFKAQLGALPYHWLQIQALAADGDYARLQDEFAAMGDALLLELGRGREPLPLRETIAFMVGQTVLEERPGEGPVAYLVQRAPARKVMLERLPELSRGMAQLADLSVLRGLFSLEEGRVSEAKVAFGEALGVWRDEATAASGGGQDFNGRAAAQDCLDWLK
jgi:hypothetical protein